MFSGSLRKRTEPGDRFHAPKASDAFIVDTFGICSLIDLSHQYSVDAILYAMAVRTCTVKGRNSQHYKNRRNHVQQRPRLRAIRAGFTARNIENIATRWREYVCLECHCSLILTQPQDTGKARLTGRTCPTSSKNSNKEELNNKLRNSLRSLSGSSIVLERCIQSPVCVNCRQSSNTGKISRCFGATA